MIKKINDKWTLAIPCFSFVTLFSSPFMNRQKQIAYVANTALFNKSFQVDLEKFSRMLTNLSIMGNSRLQFCFIAPDNTDWSKYIGELPLEFRVHNIDFVFTDTSMFTEYLMNGNGKLSNKLCIFCGFGNWHSITKSINDVSLLINSQKGVVISGGDPTKRHLVSPISMKLHTFLLLLAHFDLSFLVNNILFNIDKKFLIPQFNFQDIAHPTGINSLNYKASVEKNKRNKNNRNLHTDFFVDEVNVYNEIDQSAPFVKESSSDEKKREEESIANSTILPIPSTHNKESLTPTIHEGGSLSSGLATSVTEKLNNSSFDPNQKRNYHISSRYIPKRRLVFGNDFTTNKHFDLNYRSKTRKFHSSSRNESKFNVYTELKYFLDNSPINNETQIKIEQFLLKNGLEVLKDKSDIKIAGLYGGLYSKKTSEFLQNLKPELLKKISSFIKFKKNYQNEDSKKSVYKLYLVEIIEIVGIPYILTILLGRYIKILSNTKYNFSTERNLVLEIALDLSKDLIREYLYLSYKTHTEDLIKKGVISNLTEYTYSDWKKDNFNLFTKFDDVVKVSIGVLLIEWLEDCNLLTKKLVKLSSAQHNVYSAPDNIVDIWEKTLSTEVLTPSEESEILVKPMNILLTTPFRLPSIVTPKPYICLSDGKVRLGGYLLNDVEYADPLILKNPVLAKESIIHEKNRIYDVINKLNSVGYKINTEVLNFINTNSNYYKETLLNENPLYKKSKLTKTEKNMLQRHVSKLELQNHILSIASLFSNIPEFFFINRIDNRGRLYCVTEYLNYQSTELAKGLLLFSKPNPIYRFGNEIALIYFKAYGGNCFGNKIDKLSIKDKCGWVDSNVEKIINYENGKLIEQAENKFLFTAFCVEFKKWWNFYHYSSDSYFNTYLPIQLDATCNGFQHLVLLSGETNLRKQLNLTQANYSDKPTDFYSYILELLKDYLDNLNLEDFNEGQKSSYERLKNFCLDRKIIKNMIMTIPYNATSRKIVEDMTNLLIRRQEKVGDIETEWFIHPDDKSNKKLSYKDLFLLVSSIKLVLDKIAPKITKLQDYLQKIAEVCTKLEIHIPWLLPTGLEVRQSYLEEKTVKIKPFSYSRTQISLTSFIKKLDLKKQTRAFMPNLIHSLDATSLILLLDEYFNSSELIVKNIYTIHDCFAMPMNHVEFIIDNLRKVYTSIYSDSHYLEKLDEGILDIIVYHYRNVQFIRAENKLIITQDNEKKVFFYPNIKEVIGETLPSIDHNIRYIIK